MTYLADNLRRIEQQIAEACVRAGRGRDEVQLVAVSKGHPIETLTALRDLGVAAFGESYVQEWQEKSDALRDVHWHFIGHLQSNKARFVADRVDLVHSVDRTSLLKALARRSERVVPILLQINIGEDPAKFGASADEALELLRAAVAYDDLSVRGLMTIPPFTDDPEDARPHFRALRETFATAQTWLQAHAPARLADFTELSMGMSNDFAVAIEEGATIVRVGTALLGERR